MSFKHNFTYTIFEEYIPIDNLTEKKIKKVKLFKDTTIPDMNFTSFFKENESFNKFIRNKLKNVFEKHNLKLKKSWVQKYLKNNYHSLHIHNINEKSFVWFIEGSEKSSPLYFYDVGYPLINTHREISFKFKPGTLLIFPGFIPHEVRPNKNNNRLIVSGNVI